MVSGDVGMITDWVLWGTGVHIVIDTAHEILDNWAICLTPIDCIKAPGHNATDVPSGIHHIL
jgi:hypothetical protein